MSREDDAIAPGNAYYAPTLMAKRRKLQAELAAKVNAGEITDNQARAEMQKFQKLMFAHAREHGSEPT